MAITKDSENLYSSMRFVGDGVTKRVPLTFDLREGDGLAVDFGEGLVTDGYLIDHDVTPVVVLFSDPLPLGKTITIRRLTKIDTVKHVFQYTGNAQGGADFSAKNVDENFEQITRASQDAMDSQVLASQSLEEMAGIRDDALGARDRAVLAETNAKQSELNSKDSELKAKVSETNAKSSETTVKTSELNAKDSENKAKLSETNAEASELNAKESENNSKQSELNAKASEVSASTDASHVAQDKTQVAQDKVYVTSLKEDVVRLHAEADVSAVNAKSSELASKGSEELARKWANNPVDTPVSGSAYSAYHWAEQAKKNSASPSKFTLIQAGEGLTGGGSLEQDRTINLGTPTKITATSTNSVTDSSHTHAIDKASLTQAGILQLTNTIDDSEDKAITPKGIKEALDKLTPVDQIFYFDSPTPPQGYIARNGQAINQTSMPKLYARYGANMPDDRNRVHRMQGDLTGAVGTAQEDAIRNIKGTLGLKDGYSLAWTSVIDGQGAFKGVGSGGLKSNSDLVYLEGASSFEFDASLVVPTTDNDTRVKSRIIIACNKIQ